MTQLRDYRKKAGLTLQDLRELTGFTLSTINKHEHGIHAPSPVQIEKYRKASGGAVTSADWARLQKQREAATHNPKETIDD